MKNATHVTGSQLKTRSSDGSQKLHTVESLQERLLVFSAADEHGIQRLVKTYESYFQKLENAEAYETVLDDLCYTLCARRSSLAWKSYAVVNSFDSLKALGTILSTPTVSRGNAKTVFVFTGQGAQYRNMGQSLISNPVFRATIEQFDEQLSHLGCAWSVWDVLEGVDSSIAIDDPEVSQTSTTALQIALYNLLQALGVHPSLVVGHSSGEIAAAYASGALSLSSACKVSYYRGKCVSSLKLAKDQVSGAMMSVDLPEAEMQKAISQFMASQPSRGMLYIACVNSPSNVTISGDKESIDAIQLTLIAGKIRTRKLNTGVAYHSPHMNAIGQQYAKNLSCLGREKPGEGNKRPIMVTSVSGEYVFDSSLVCTPAYWVANLLSPVQFFKAMAVISSEMDKKRTRRLGEAKLDIQDIVEIGPHSALRRPILDCLKHYGVPQAESRYHSVLFRGSPAIKCIMDLIGRLHCRGYPVKTQKANELRTEASGSARLLTDLPYYPFNHSKTYWHESLISRNTRLRNGVAIHELLGVPVPDWNPLEPRWRKFFDLNEMPWVGGHRVNGRIIYPAAGMVTMALQGAEQVADRNRCIAAFQIRDAVFTAPITISKTEKCEVQLHMRLDRAHSEHHATSLDFRVYSMSETGWFLNCSGSVQVVYQRDDEDASNTSTLQKEQQFYRKRYSEAVKRSTLQVSTKKLYEQLRSNGMQYDNAFQPLSDLAWDGAHTAIGTVKCFKSDSELSEHDLQPHIMHPTVLDGAGQLPWLCLTEGAEKAVFNGFAVTRIREAWIASSGLSYPDSSYINACCTTALKGLRGSDTSIFALDANGRLVLRVSHIETTAVGGNETASLVHSPRRIAYKTSYQPDLGMLDAAQMQDLVNEGLEPESPPISFYEDLDLALFYFILRALDYIETMDIRVDDMGSNIVKYLSWLRRQVEKYYSGEIPHSRPDWIERTEDSGAMEGLLERLAAMKPEGEFFIHVGRSLHPIIHGLTDPLEVIFQNELAERFYEATCDKSMCCKQLKNYLGALCHGNPQLKVLEVGAGTGSITKHLLQGLQNRFARYDYTDISGSFFEQAKGKFAGLKNMTYKVLDIEKDPSEQGFELHSYDVVVAASVFHATRDLAATIFNAHSLLKSGGKLILLEITEPALLRNTFAFGTLPGWWLSTEPERQLSPCLTEAQWREALAGNGFNGVDLFLPDYESDICHENSILIATAAQESIPGDRGATTGLPTYFTIVISPNSSFQRDVASGVQAEIENQGLGSCSIISIEDPGLVNLAHTVMIILAEIDQPFLASLDQSSFNFLQAILTKVQKILWVTSSAVSSPTFPEVQMVLGLARVLFVEKPSLQFVTLSFSSPAHDMELFVRCISQVTSDTVAKLSCSGRDLEYVERDGTLLIGRVVDSDELNERVCDKTQTIGRRLALSDSPPLKLSIANSGLLDSIRWEADPQYHTDLDPNEIEIKVQAVGVNFRDLLVVLGKYSESTVGCECAGIVTRIGAHCNALKPGDRVCAFVIGCSNTHARCNYQLAVEIPDSLSMAEAASLPCTGVTAYHSLISLAHISSEDSILIHSATGATGQMAVQIAVAVGSEIFVTVGNEEKRRLIEQLYGIPDDHIFNSRDTSFASDIYYATKGRGVDIVLNSLSKDLLLASWECIAPFGRFVELGKMDIEENSKLPMSRFSKNVTFHAVAIDHLSFQKPQVVGRALQSVLDMIVHGSMRIASPLQQYPVSDLESAFRFMQSGKNTGKIILTFSPSDIVRTWLSPKHSCSLDPDVTYLIAGGLGGLGPKSTPAYALLDELKKAGCIVRTPRCDISDTSSLTSALAMCSDLPPIKGCLQATMVLKDTLFESMTWDQWSISTRSKVNSTWNLHRQLPQGLSFFVMLASVAGVAGSIGQSNYAAGNTFQDGFAAHRVALGERAVSIDLGWMRDIGAVAENADLKKFKEDTADMASIYENEFLALLDFYCDPELPVLAPQQAQPVIGLMTPAQFRTNGMKPPDWLVQRPLFWGLEQEAKEQDGVGGALEITNDRDWVAELLHSASREEAIHIVAEALVQRLSNATSIPAAEIDRTRPLHAYGVDSLLAVELRNWFSQLFKADVAVFDITGQASLDKVAERAAGSSSLLKKVDK
ncbi:hypothetical protein KVR01_013117 [Diaporthe batatas]|uniref:uncharacterized protein n=1 Tax=Diaporthe batatas TaxID=748121 RepID=UPI001D046423|nr:uncharacterized protein KVR01_013117 [Diaporthe batatas]KAG8157127.1 hypothetical protein KVR01_013117 [Diaporthe batatas]